MKLKVLYNSACPVCDSGIKKQKTKMTIIPIDWQDIHNDTSELQALGLDINQVRKKLHVLDSDGELHIGFDAFLAIWKHNSNEKWKYKIFNKPIVKHICRISYNLFASHLYQWNKLNKHW